jgi:hypothetical protein
MLVLTLDVTGMPREWVPIKESIGYFTTEKVLWTLGSPIKTFYGGVQNSGVRSSIEAYSIIAVSNHRYKRDLSGCVNLSNRTLFGRDRHICAYCGKQFKMPDLSRDHILPKAQGGENRWMNVVTACILCNTKKGNRTPEQAKMQLLYTPYIPNLYEHLLLQNRNILADQMEYLKTGIPRHSRLL